MNNDYFAGFTNAKTGDLEKDEYKIILVSKESQAEPYSTYRALEDTVYKGHKNSIFFVRRYGFSYFKKETHLI